MLDIGGLAWLYCRPITHVVVMSCPLPKFAKRLHDQSVLNREQIKLSMECGCFYCLKVYPAFRVDDWTDKGNTGLCPLCGVDAVIPDASLDRPLTVELLEGLQATYFLSEKSLGPGGRFQHLSLGIRQSEPSYEPLEGRCLEYFGWPSGGGLRLDASSLDDLLTPSEMTRRVVSRISPLPIVVLGCGLAVALMVKWLGVGSEQSSQLLAGWLMWVVAGCGTLGALMVKARHYHQAFLAIRAIRSEDWKSPALALSMGLSPHTDLSIPKTTDSLFRDARDWARATKNPSLKRLWGEWMASPDDVRNENLRQFIRAARSDAGPHGPYEPGDPL